MKIAIVYFSSTGNTEEMANLLYSDLKQLNIEVKKFSAEDFSVKELNNYSTFLFGCPAMGNEELDVDIFRPMWDSVKKHLLGANVGLFGSYDWGDGDWLDSWEEEATDLGINVVGTVSSNLDPDSDDEVNLNNLAIKISEK